MSTNSGIGERIRHLRLSYLSLTQEEFAEHLGVSRVTVNRWEAGVVVPRPSSIRHIAELFQVPVSWLTGADDES